MVVNNSVKIGTMMSFGPDDFYFVQVLKRRKDNLEMERNMDHIKNYYIESLDQYIKLVPKIIELCDRENARAYIRPNKRNYKKLGLMVIKRVADYISTGNNRAIKSVFDSVAGEFHSDPDKKWVVDIDWIDFDEKKSKLSLILTLIQELVKETGRDDYVEILPTKNGCHLICRPFNLEKFRKEYPLIDVHKDGMTIIYC